MPDPSGLIFVVLAIAWAVYLIPKALEHHEASARERGVDSFSSRMKVLARRDAVSGKRTELLTETDSVEAPASRPAAAPKAPKAPKTAAPVRSASARAARRRRRVLSLILVAAVTVAAAAGLGRIGWVWGAIPAGLLVAWLVACRLMVKRERRRPVARAPRPVDIAVASVVIDVDDEGYPVAPVESVAEPVETVNTTEQPEQVEPTELGPKPTWEPQPLTLPMYVAKAPAPRRSVMTIDLESTGVWTSGRSDADTELVRQAEDAADAAAESDEDRKSS